MATLQDLQAQRQDIINRIHAKGGRANAPRLSSQLAGLEDQIRQMRSNPPAPQPDAGAGPAPAPAPQPTFNGIPVSQLTAANAPNAASNLAPSQPAPSPAPQPAPAPPPPQQPAPAQPSTPQPSSPPKQSDSGGTNSITTKYGDRIDVTGLDPDQIDRVRGMAEDNGPNGAKGAALARTFRNLGAQDNGDIDPDQAFPDISESSQEDTLRNFNLNNPESQTLVGGSRRDTYIDPVTGQVSIREQAGAPLQSAQNAFMSAAGDFGQNGKSGMQAAQDANYNFITKNYGYQKQQEVEAAKQDLAQRGIPMDADPNSLYSRTLKNIDIKYQDLYDQAHNQALATGAQTYASYGDVLGQASNAVNNLTPFRNTFSAFSGAQSNQTANMLGALGTVSSANLQKYGIDQNMLARLGDMGVQLYGINQQGANARLAADTQRYGYDSSAGTQRYISDQDLAGRRYGYDSTAATSRYTTDQDVAARNRAVNVQKYGINRDYQARLAELGIERGKLDLARQQAGSAVFGGNAT